MVIYAMLVEEFEKGDDLMLTKAQKLNYFRQYRNRNYRASLRLEGFNVSTETDTDLDKLTAPQILQRIQQIKASYAG